MSYSKVPRAKGILRQLVMIAQMILIILQVQLGAGQHVDAIDDEDNIKGLHLNFVTQPLCLVGLVLVKISIGILLLRLTTSKKFTKFIWGTIIFTSAAFLGNFRRSFRPLSVTGRTYANGSSNCNVPMPAIDTDLGHVRGWQMYASIEPQVRGFFQL